MICLISLSKFSNGLRTFTCVSAIGNLWSICLGVYIFRPSSYFVLHLAADAIEEYSLNNLITACHDS